MSAAGTRKPAEKKFEAVIFVRVTQLMKDRFQAAAFKTPLSESKITRALIEAWVTKEEAKAEKAKAAP